MYSMKTWADKIKSDDPTTLGNLTKNYPSIAWKEWLTALFPSTTVFTDNEPIILSDASYITDLQNLMATTPKKVVANYIFWRAVYESAWYLDERMHRMIIKVLPIWEQCVDTVSDNFGLSTTSLVVKEHFNEKAKTTASEISANIKAEFVKMFHAVN